MKPKDYYHHAVAYEVVLLILVLSFLDHDFAPVEPLQIGRYLNFIN